MLRISQLKLPVEHTEAQLKKKLLKTAHIKEQDLKQFFIRKRSVDGRKKPELYYVYTVDLIVANEEHVKKMLESDIGAQIYSDFEAARKMLSSGMVVEYLLKPASEDELFEAVFKCIERIDQTRGPDDPVPLEEPGPEPPSFHENAQPRGSKVLLIQQVKEYLQENYTQRITLNSAAALVYLTPTYLSKLFAEVEGMGFSEYLSALRIQHAKEALLDYHRRIYEIAAQVGYQDVKHFMKVFKKQVGMTPREYRESHLF